MQIPNYKQTSNVTCGSSCLMMVGNYFHPNRFPLNRTKEEEIHEEVKFWRGDKWGELEDIGKVAFYALESGFEVTFFIDFDEDNFERPPEVPIEVWKKYTNIFFKTFSIAKKKGMKVVEKTSVDIITQEVSEERPVICEISYESQANHFIVIRGRIDNTFYTIDPLASNQYRKIHCNNLERMIDLGYGSNFLSFKPKVNN